MNKREMNIFNILIIIHQWMVRPRVPRPPPLFVIVVVDDDEEVPIVGFVWFEEHHNDGGLTTPVGT